MEQRKALVRLLDLCELKKANLVTREANDNRARQQTLVDQVEDAYLLF